MKPESIEIPFVFGSGQTIGAAHVNGRVETKAFLTVESCQDAHFVLPFDPQRGIDLAETESGAIRSYPVIATVADGVSDSENSHAGATWLAKRAAISILKVLRLMENTDIGIGSREFWSRVKCDIVREMIVHTLQLTGSSPDVIEQVRQLPKHNVAAPDPTPETQDDTPANPATCKSTASSPLERKVSYYVRAVENQMLATLVCLVMTEQHTVIAHVGDGFAGVNGELLTLEGVVDDGCPLTLAYELTGLVETVNFVVARVIPTSQVNSVFISSDGLRYSPDLKPGAARRSADSPMLLEAAKELEDSYFMPGYRSLDTVLRMQNNTFTTAEPVDVGGNVFCTVKTEPQVFGDDLAVVIVKRV